MNIKNVYREAFLRKLEQTGDKAIAKKFAKACAKKINPSKSNNIVEMKELKRLSGNIKWLML